MKILLIHQNFCSPDQPGGTRHFELASHLVRQGHEPTIVTSRLDYNTGVAVDDATGWITRQVIDGVRILRSYAYPSLHRSFTWRAVSMLSFMLTSVWAGFRAGPVDVVMGTTPPIFQLPSAWLIAKLRRRPFVLEVRDLWPEFAVEMGILKNPLIIRIARWVERFFYAHANHIVVNSPAYRDYLIGKGVPPRKISVVPNGVDPGMFDPAADGAAIRRQLGLREKYLVTYAGALGQANDVGTILRGAARLAGEPDVHFLLVGDGKERTNLARQVEQLGLKNVTFAGTYPKSRMHEVLAASDVCVATLQNVPMFRTVYPNKIFDYMAAGRPTLLGIDGVIREVVEAAGGGIFVPPGDDAALADAVRYMHQNRQEAQGMGRAARAYVVAHFDRCHHANRLEKLLRRLADGV